MSFDKMYTAKSLSETHSHRVGAAKNVNAHYRAIPHAGKLIFRVTVGQAENGRLKGIEVWGPIILVQII